MFDDLLQFWLLAIDLNSFYIYNTYVSQFLACLEAWVDGLVIADDDQRPSYCNWWLDFSDFCDNFYDLCFWLILRELTWKVQISPCLAVQIWLKRVSTLSKHALFINGFQEKQSIHCQAKGLYIIHSLSQETRYFSFYSPRTYHNSRRHLAFNVRRGTVVIIHEPSH